MKIDWKWRSRYLEIARQYSLWSKDPSTKIGAIAVGENGQLLSEGYNGFPRGIEDDSRLDEKEKKYDLIVHGEMNVIYNACFNGVSLKNSTLFVFGLPICSSCANGVIQVGFDNVCMAVPRDVPQKWTDNWELSKLKFQEAGLEYQIVEYETADSSWLDAARLREVYGFYRAYAHKPDRREFSRTYSGSESKLITEFF